MSIVSRSLFNVLILFTTLACAGCSKSFTFIVVGTIKDAINATSIEDVKLTVNCDGERNKPERDLPTILSNRDGEFSIEFKRDHHHFWEGQPGWCLKVEKDGYISEYVEIKPKTKPNDYGTPTNIVVVIYLRPVK